MKNQGNCGLYTGLPLRSKAFCTFFQQTLSKIQENLLKNEVLSETSTNFIGQADKLS